MTFIVNKNYNIYVNNFDNLNIQTDFVSDDRLIISMIFSSYNSEIKYYVTCEVLINHNNWDGIKPDNFNDLFKERIIELMLSFIHEKLDDKNDICINYLLNYIKNTNMEFDPSWGIVPGKKYSNHDRRNTINASILGYHQTDTIITSIRVISDCIFYKGENNYHKCEDKKLTIENIKIET